MKIAYLFSYGLVCGGKYAGVYKNAGMAVTCMQNRCDVVNVMKSKLSDAKERERGPRWDGGGKGGGM